MRVHGQMSAEEYAAYRQICLELEEELQDSPHSSDGIPQQRLRREPLSRAPLQSALLTMRGHTQARTQTRSSRRYASRAIAHAFSRQECRVGI